MGELERELIAASEFEFAQAVWTWNSMDKKPTEDGTSRKLPMWHRFRVELYPHCRECATTTGGRWTSLELFACRAG